MRLDEIGGTGIGEPVTVKDRSAYDKAIDVVVNELYDEVLGHEKTGTLTRYTVETLLSNAKTDISQRLHSKIRRNMATEDEHTDEELVEAPAPAMDAMEVLQKVLQKYHDLESIPLEDAMTDEGHKLRVEFADPHREINAEALERKLMKELRKEGHRAQSATVTPEGVSAILYR